MPGIKTDVFISYSSTDREIVARIVARLTAANLQVWFDRAAIGGGGAFISEIEEGLQTSQVTVLFLSPAALQSSWVENEWNARLIQMSKDRTKKLIPVLLHDVKDGDIPLMLQRLSYLDFRGTDFDDPLELESVTNDLIANVKGELPPAGVEAIGVPFVVFAMTNDEATQLATKTVFGQPHTDKTAFESIVAKLDYQVEDIPRFYGATREDWQPPPAKSETVRCTIEDMVSRINGQLPASAPILRPQFFSEDFLSDDINWRLHTWKRLRNMGCVLVIDVLSMFHPKLQTLLLQSGFSTAETVSIVVLSPIQSEQLKIEPIILDIKNMLQIAFDRWENDLDMLCEFGIGNARAFRRWLYSVLPEAARRAVGEKPNPDAKRRISEQLQAQYGKATGMERAIRGKI